MRKKPYFESERRRYVRLEPEEPISVRFKVIEESRRRKVATGTDRAKTKSVGGGGMFLEIPPLKPKMLDGLLRGTHVLSLQIDIPNVSRPIKVLARVIWVEGKRRVDSNRYGVGVSFIGISEDDREKIMNYVIDSCSG